MIEFSVVVESYTLTEGGSPERIRRILESAIAMISKDTSAEVLLIDVSGSATVRQLIKDYPQVRPVAAYNLNYDAAKMRAVQAAQGRYALFLDGDCLPSPDWHQKMLAPLRGGQIAACGGYTRYEGGFLAALMSVMDFGFMYPRTERELQCYASNNFGFLRDVLLEIPTRDGYARCSCYHHTQLLLEHAIPIRLVADALVLHEQQPIVRERSRQGYDTIAACWANPRLPQARWLRLGIFSLPLFYAFSLFLDYKRAWLGRKDLGWSFWQLMTAFFLFPVFRLIDASGMIYAIVHGAVKGGWNGFEPSPFGIRGQVSNVPF